MLAIKRQAAIFKYIKDNGNISIDYIVKEYEISKMTAWRDLKSLEEQKLVRKVYGGAVALPEGDPNELAFQRRMSSPEKIAIAQYAALELVKDGSIIFLDAGSTPSQMVPFFDQKSLTVISNGLNTLLSAAKLVPALTVMGTGGFIRELADSFVGPQTVDFVNRYKADVVFISGLGLTLEEGLTEASPLELAVKQAMVTNATKKVVLLESSKFNRRSVLPFLSLSEIDLLVTDDSGSEDFINELRKKHVKVHVVEMPKD